MWKRWRQRQQRDDRSTSGFSGRLFWWPCASSVSMSISASRFSARGVIFVDLALAQIAALGATVAFMLGHPVPKALRPMAIRLSFTLFAALLLAFTRQWATRIPQEALIGVIYVVAAAAAILLIDRAPQGAEHLKQVLTGNILTSGVKDRCLHRSALYRCRISSLVVGRHRLMAQGLLSGNSFFMRVSVWS